VATVVTTEKIGPVAVVTLHGPKANALGDELVSQIWQALDDAERDPKVGCLAITSRKNFCSGADLDAIRAAGPDPLDEAIYARFGRIYDLFARIATARIPTIAGVGGHVVGAGINLALACDVRIVADDLLVRGFAAGGVHPGGGHLKMLSQQLERGAAAAMALFGQPLTATDAVSSGFALRAVPPDRLRAELLSVAAGAGDDTELTRSVTATYRATVASDLSPAAAILLERAPQVWSLRRRHTHQVRKGQTTGE
jgi:enoyl-CoA hydratase